MKFIGWCALGLFASSSYAGYDSSWFEANYWSGEYPNGFSVVRKHVKIPGRVSKDKDTAATLSCPVPYKAVIHGWNIKRNEKTKPVFASFTKIVTLTAKDDYVGVGEGTDTYELKAGEKFEYLNYLSEGYFQVRVRGVVYVTDISLLDHIVEGSDGIATDYDEWVNLPCGTGQRAWIYLNDVAGYPGIADIGPGLVEYGTVRDLTDAEAKALDKDDR